MPVSLNVPKLLRLARSVVAASALVGAANAGELAPEMRQYVIASCSADAYRLCPQSLDSANSAVKCMRAKRRELGQTCRVAYDKVARILAQ
jgi:hypothetical protein